MLSHPLVGSAGSQSVSFRKSPLKPIPTSIARDVVRRSGEQRGPQSDKAADELFERIASGEFTEAGSTKEKLTRPLRRLLAGTGVGRGLAMSLAQLGRSWRAEAAQRMPEARGDLRELVGQPVFVPLYKLFTVYGKIFRLSFGPKSFVIISDPAYARQILLTNADKYSKGLLSEILEFVMGTGLIPADGEVWRMRRRAIVPALHKKYVANMVGMFGDCTLHGCATLDAAVASGKPIDMENFFSRLSLDIIGKAVFNYDFDSLTHDDPVIQAVYVVLREAEYRSTYPIAYWNLPGAMQIVPRQRRCVEALKVVNDTLDGLIAKCKVLVEEEDAEFVEEFLSEADPSILHFLIASGDQISSKQLRDDLMTMLVAGHETTAAVLTWTLYLLSQHPDKTALLQQEVDSVLGGRVATLDDIRALRYTTRVINEAMRLYPQPPVLIRRALEEDSFGDIKVPAGSDFFISVWNLHRSPALWEDPEAFRPERFGPLDGPTPNEVTTNFAYLPFGGGRRKCIGDQFALFESIVALAMFMHRYEFTLAPGETVGMTTGATIHTTNGLNMIVKRRVPPTPSTPSLHHPDDQLAPPSFHPASTQLQDSCCPAAAQQLDPSTVSSSNGVVRSGEAVAVAGLAASAGLGNVASATANTFAASSSAPGGWVPGGSRGQGEAGQGPPATPGRRCPFA
ncbi:cytochrome P450 [Haematococcus lacustris]